MAITGNLERPKSKRGATPSRELTPEKMKDMLTNDLDSELGGVNVPETKKNYQIMMTPSIHDKGARAAAGLGDSFSGLMESLLDEYLRTRHYGDM